MRRRAKPTATASRSPGNQPSRPPLVSVFSRPLLSESDCLGLGRMGDGEDIASAVAFLCSRSAAYITGSTLTVDGGYTTALDLQTLGTSSAAQT